MKYILLFLLVSSSSLFCPSSGTPKEQKKSESVYYMWPGGPPMEDYEPRVSSRPSTPGMLVPSFRGSVTTFKCVSIAAAVEKKEKD